MSSNLNYEQLFEHVGDAIVVCDTEGRILFWNAAAVNIFGFDRSEAVGESLDIIVPERLRKRHWDGYNSTMASGKTRYGHNVLRVPALNKSGATLSIAFTVALLKDAEGGVTGIASVIRDETERFKEERALRARLAEFESAAGGAT